MKDKNFNNLKNLKAPDTWIENAINIPQDKNQPKAPIILKYSRILAAVACLVLVCTVSLVLFFTRDTDILLVNPDYTQSTSSTDNNASSTQGNKNNHKDNKKPTDNNGGAPIEDESSSSEKPTSKNEEPTARPTQATQKPNKPTQKPPETKPSEDTEEPLDPPIEKPSEPAWEEPSEEPTDQPIEPSSPPEAPPGSISAVFSTFILKSEYTGGNVYCKIIDSNGKLLGDSDLYSSQHRSSVAGYTKDSYLLEYNASSKGVVTQPGYYTCYFYDGNGKVYNSYSTYVE